MLERRNPRVSLACALLVAVGACARAETDAQSIGHADGGLPAFAEGGPPPPSEAGEVFGHSSTVLYRIDTATRRVTEIGFLAGCGHVADIALDQGSTIHASNGAELFVVENNTGRCTRIAEGSFPNSLSFVPSGVLGSGETLVGFEGGSYVKIDSASGVKEKLGDLGGGFESSGDIVSVRDGKTFVTVKGSGCADCLVEIDPRTGGLTKNWGPLGFADAFGLAFWGGELYAFTDDGRVLLVTLKGEALETTELEVPEAPAGLSFRGAGSTTSAPVGPVR